MKHKEFGYTHGALDYISVDGSLITASGWVVGLEGEVTELRMTCNDVPLPTESTTLNAPSPDVYHVIPAIRNSANCRFRISARLTDTYHGASAARLFSVVPMMHGTTGVPLERILPIRLAIPGQELSTTVGHGDFLETAFAMLSLFRLIGGLSREASILDPGCGIGRIAFALFHYLGSSGRYRGFDVSKTAIELAQHIFPADERFAFTHVGIHNTMYNPDGSEAGEGFSFPYRSGDFDFVVMTSVFTHLLERETQQYLNEISRMLASGGACFATFFILDEFAKSSINDNRATLPIAHRLSEGCYVQDPNVPEGAVGFDFATLKRMIGVAGLTIEDIHWGSWSGRFPFLSYQDILLLRKP